MAVSSTPTRPDSPAPAARAPRRPRGEGQWALGHHEPLNPNERIKKDDDPLNVRARIENIYAHRGFASIDPPDLRGRMRWWGLYTQRKPASTAAAPPCWSRTSWTTSTSCSGSGSTAAQLNLAQLRAIARHLPRVRPRHRRHHRPAEHPAALDPDRGRAGDLAPAGGGRPADHRGLRRLPPGRAGQPGRRGGPGRGARPDAGDRRDRPPVRRRQGVLQPAPQVQDRRSPGWSTRRTRPTTSRSSAWSTRSTVPASTSGSAAGCPPTRCSPSGSASGCRWTRCRTCGPAWSASSATTATAGCATGPG